ncbi:retrotransposon protein, putative, ty1-copia subclass [Tanacetum coccineum]
MQLTLVAYLLPYVSSYWIVLSTEDKLPFLEQPIHALPVPPQGQENPPDVITTHQAWVKAQKEIIGLMLMTMDLEIQKTLEHLGAYDMLKELKTFYVQQAGASSDQRLGHAMTQNLSVSLILVSLRKEYKGFVQNYNMHSMGKTVNELNAMLKLHEQTLPPKEAPPFAPKPKNPPTPKKNNLTKDAICHQCGEGLRGTRKLKPGALSLYVGDGHREAVEAIGDFHLSKLNLDSALLWHCRLGHINKKRIKKLQHDGLLDSTDIESFVKCVACMSGKMARKPYSHQVERAKDLLGLIHTDVCGPFKIMSRQGAYYFVTFTDDFSRYGYVYLLKHKYEVFETFKVFQKEVENQLGKTIKSLRSDCGGEYMSQEFLNHLKDHGIIAHRTPPYTP